MHAKFTAAALLPGIGLGDYRAWEHPFIVPTIVNFTGNYRALFAGFYRILRYNTQNSTNIASLAKP